MVEVNETLWKKMLGEIPLMWKHITKKHTSIYVRTETGIMRLGYEFNGKYYMVKELADAYMINV